MDQEIWKDVAGYEGKYQVSDWGRVKGLDRVVTDKNGIKYHLKGRILKDGDNGKGYRSIILNSNGRSKTLKVHRLVGFAFIPNPENKPFINHKDGHEENNYLWNLEWSTESENQLHSFRELGRKGGQYGKIGILNHLSKSINQLSKTNEFIKRWDCTMDIERELGLYHSDISKCCIGYRTRQTVGGFKWQFAEPVPE